MPEVPIYQIIASLTQFQYLYTSNLIPKSAPVWVLVMPRMNQT